MERELQVFNEKSLNLILIKKSLTRLLILYFAMIKTSILGLIPTIISIIFIIYVGFKHICGGESDVL